MRRTIYRQPHALNFLRLLKRLIPTVVLFVGSLAITATLHITYAGRLSPQTAIEDHALPSLAIDSWEEMGRLVHSDSSGGFGYTVAISGEVIAVGASGDDEMAGNAGAVYVYERPGSGWTDGVETAKLTASDAAIADHLGISISISGDTIVAGATGDGNNGSVYVFEKPSGGWVDGTETAKLTASDGVSDEFGISVDVSGDTIVIGARGDDDNGNNAGSVYVFMEPGGGWITATEDAKLTASDAHENQLFGNDVAIDENTIVIGAHGDDTSGNGSGAAYVFTMPTGGWATGTETAKLTASDGEASDFFGIVVAIDGDTVVAGASSDSVGSNADQGSAYVFIRGGGWSTGTETAKLTASDGAWLDEFGKSVSVSGDMVVVGAHWDDWGATNIFDEGSAYVFVEPLTGWVDATETAKLTASDGEPGDEFGTGVAIEGQTLVIGAYQDPVEIYPGFGSAYVYELFEPTDYLYLPLIRR